MQMFMNEGDFYEIHKDFLFMTIDSSFYHSFPPYTLSSCYFRSPVQKWLQDGGHIRQFSFPAASSEYVICCPVDMVDIRL